MLRIIGNGGFKIEQSEKITLKVCFLRYWRRIDSGKYWLN
jgi:hypothetical protein